eukprot:TRINITY_DN332_c0_g6_i1.p1 TRINITY_DN332_c0_g6~~TRINITY_DN332_c0_g6_i1.p1  ORF type:complete len:475 (+),score=134.30 TRINITY_DN332_c0_g6_i1:92-1516(+)
MESIAKVRKRGQTSTLSGIVLSLLTLIFCLCEMIPLIMSQNESDDDDDNNNELPKSFIDGLIVTCVVVCFNCILVTFWSFYGWNSLRFIHEVKIKQFWKGIWVIILFCIVSLCLIIYCMITLHNYQNLSFMWYILIFLIAFIIIDYIILYFTWPKILEFLKNEEQPLLGNSSTNTSSIIKPEGDKRDLELIQQLLDEAQTKNWFVKMTDIQLQDKIGTGASATVWKANWKGATVACKMIHFLVDSYLLKDFYREANLLSMLRHPNVIMFLGASVNENYLMIMTEFAELGSLARVLYETNCELNAKQKNKLLLDSAYGMQYLHTLTPPVIHRDLKSHNLLVMMNFNVKITDFGSSKQYLALDQMTFSVGSIMWSAPEVLSRKNYSCKADVYSFAVIIYEVITREELYVNKPIYEIVNFVVRGERLELPKAEKIYDNEVIELMQQCWKQEPDERPDFTLISNKLQQCQNKFQTDNL